MIAIVKQTFWANKISLKSLPFMNYFLLIQLRLSKLVNVKQPFQNRNFRLHNKLRSGVLKNYFLKKSSIVILNFLSIYIIIVLFYFPRLSAQMVNANA